MHPAIAQHRPGISAVCQRYRIQRLDVFGSAARTDDFDASSSDADFLVEFEADMPVAEGMGSGLALTLFSFTTLSVAARAHSTSTNSLFDT